ncbi:MarR family winged helix-turn-helix transcriptional regulator [Neptunicella marina]|uniref:MarR family transcriptional regulator n=1 Tax=Neptunicella marina TaxID=2125989 RepID=A0A8J6IRX4_9ALTE|nr:MarR family transcriptional regulator [Neptunicella marina]MBC3765274.1 MarR family transcriptional regulator [Neptunicella marina]
MQSLTSAMQLAMALFQAQSGLLKPLDRSLSLHGISFTELMVMLTLQQAPQSSMRRIELADAIGLSASGVTRLLLPMEKNHLVEKQQNQRDARVSLVKLTDTGQQILSDALTTFEQSAQKATQSLTSKQIEQCLQLLGALRA